MKHFIKLKENNPAYSNGMAYLNNNPSSTYRVEADQKDIIIRNLQADAENLRKSELQYYRLTDQHKQLQHKFKMQTDQKLNEDREFKMRHDSAVRNIVQLKNQIDALRAQLRDKNIQINDLESDFDCLKSLIDERNIEMEGFRNDYRGGLTDNEELLAQKESLSATLSKLRQVIGAVQEEDSLLKQDNESVNRRLEELSKYQVQLLSQERIVREKILAYENENNDLDGVIQDLSCNLSQLQMNIRQAQAEHNELQTTIADLTQNCQQYKSQMLHIQKNVQSQIGKNSHFSKLLKQAQYTMKVRNGQVEEGEKEVVGLKVEKQQLESINKKLEQDLQACRAHLQNLGLINHKLVENLESFSAQDDTVRQMLNRRPRVDFLRQRVTEVNQGNFKHRGSSNLSTKHGQQPCVTASQRSYRY